MSSTLSGRRMSDTIVEAFKQFASKKEKSDYYREQYYLGNYRRPCSVCGVEDLVKNMYTVDTHREKQIALADMECPVCDGVMLVRVGRYRQEKQRSLFCGCSNFPRCRHTEEYNGKWYKDGELVITENKASPDFYCEQHFVGSKNE